MTSRYIRTDTIVNTGAAAELTGFIDALYVAANTTLAGTGAGQTGVVGSNNGKLLDAYRRRDHARVR